MKTAVIYYSLDGSCELLANMLKEEMGADVFSVELKDGKKRKGPFKFLWALGTVLLKKQPAVKMPDIDYAKYDLLILGAPVWAAHPAPPMTVFLGNANFSGKKVALFCTHAGGPGDALRIFKAYCAANDVIGEIDFANASGDPAAREKLRTWVKGLPV